MTSAKPGLVSSISAMAVVGLVAVAGWAAVGLVVGLAASWTLAWAC